ncbi:MAG: glycosyltransferase family 4 protein [Hyphomonas sp.]|nr:glycosyltransferase family 4 protein [Hyphomonas sp.]
MTASFLHVTPITPRPSGNGLAMRTAMFAEALSSIGRTEILVLGDEPPVDCSNEGLQIRHWDTRGRHDTRLQLINAIGDPQARADALRALGRPFASRAVSLPIATEFAQLTQQYPWSGILFSRAHLLPLLDFLDHAPCPVIVDLDDDDGELARQRARLARRNGEDAHGLWLETEADMLDAMVKRAAATVRLFTVASANVAETLNDRLSLSSIKTIANGIEIPSIDQIRRSASDKLLFVGNLSYPPNADGLTWFIQNVWPRVLAVRPATSLMAAGSNPSKAVTDLFPAPQATLVRDPADLAPLYAAAAAGIVPLRTGSGSRIKILEAAAHNVPVVSTVVGADGLALDPNQALFATPTDPEAFSNACLACLSNPVEAAARAARLRAYVELMHERSGIVSEIAATLSAVLRP